MSANYSTESLKLKLGKMNGTQESIQVTSYWFVFHQKHARESVKTWAEHLASSLPSRKLFYLYLANDVLQSSKKKGNLFAAEFEKVLPGVFEATYKFVNPDLKQRVKKVLQVWKDRKVYKDEFLDLLDQKAGLSAVEPVHSPPQMNDDQDDDDSMAQSTSVGGHPKLATIAQGLKSLDESQEAMVGAITRVNAIREKLFSIDESSSTSDPTQLESFAAEIAGALEHVGVYQSMLADEIATRENIKNEALQLLALQDSAINNLNEHLKNMQEKHDLLSQNAQAVVNKSVYNSNASTFAPYSDPGLSSATKSNAEEGNSASVESDGTMNPYNSVHPATLNRISQPLQANTEEFEL